MGVRSCLKMGNERNIWCLVCHKLTRHTQLDGEECFECNKCGELRCVPRI